MNGAPLRRLGLIGDVHTEDALLESTLRFLEGESLDAVACTGDISDGGGDIDRSCALLREHEVLTVSGNHDRWLLTGEQASLRDATRDEGPEARAFLASLPETILLPTPRGGALLCHGVGEDDMAVLRPDTRGYALGAIPELRELMLDPDVSYMLGGHTHQSMVRKFVGVTVVNAGTLHRRYAPGFCVVDFVAEEVAHYLCSGGRLRLAHTEPLPRPAEAPPD
ncbi:MAG: metallophosphoesterase family protein [Deltaproteobacteria bacterium]|nr:metallophosphoesterase family protein [Deltaproteobacteria bacterium]